MLNLYAENKIMTVATLMKIINYKIRQQQSITTIAFLQLKNLPIFSKLQKSILAVLLLFMSSLFL